MTKSVEAVRNLTDTLTEETTMDVKALPSKYEGLLPEAWSLKVHNQDELASLGTGNLEYVKDLWETELGYAHQRAIEAAARLALFGVKKSEQRHLKHQLKQAELYEQKARDAISCLTAALQLAKDKPVFAFCRRYDWVVRGGEVLFVTTSKAVPVEYRNQLLDGTVVGPYSHAERTLMVRVQLRMGDDFVTPILPVPQDSALVLRRDEYMALVEDPEYRQLWLDLHRRLPHRTPWLTKVGHSELGQIGSSRASSKLYDIGVEQLAALLARDEERTQAALLTMAQMPTASGIRPQVMVHPLTATQS